MDSFARLLDTCARTLSRYENVAAEGAVLAAVSGGMDSTLLLLALTRLREEGRLPGPLRVAHVDHGVRPDSAANAQHVAELCDRLEVPCQIEHLRWSQSETPGEDALRDARYAALEACARDVGARMLVTAHHADDNLETVLFRMLRGTGPRGLAGIPESRWLGDDAYPTNVCFGGADRRTIFTTELAPGRVCAVEGLPTPGLPLHPWPAP